MRADAKQLARAGYTYIGRLYSEMDCQAFVERCLRDCGITINLAGSNTWYRRMTWTGTPEECKKQFGHIPVGAFLFIVEHDGKEPVKYRGDGIGNASHIGIYTSQGKGAIHSSASRGCVVESRFTGKSIRGGWNRVGLWKGVMYDVDILAKGEKEEGVVTMQTAIVSGGDGKYPVHMRVGPGRDYVIETDIPQNSEVELIEDGPKWCKVKFESLVGFVMTEFVHKTDGTDAAARDEMVTVSRRDLETMREILDNILGRG